MRQVMLRNPDFSYPDSDVGRFRDDGRKLISMMRRSGIDKNERDKMRVHLANAEHNMRANRKGMFKELTKTGHPTFMGQFGMETIGVYNPDEIPVSTYSKMKTDSQVALGLAVIKLPLLSLSRSIECEDSDIAMFVDEALGMVWNKMIKSMLTAIEYGFASHEKVWWRYPLEIYSTSGTGRRKTHFSGLGEVYKKIKAHYPDTVRIRVDKDTGDFIGIVQDVGGGEPPQILNKNKCFFFALEDDFGNYYGGSRLKQAYKPWYWKEVMYQFMLRYFERRGTPPTQVTFPPGVNRDADGNEVDNAEVALRIGQSLVENSVVTVPYEETKDGRDTMWKVEYLQDDRRGPMFVECINHLEVQILRGLLVPERTVTQDISTGSYSMAATHAEAFLLEQAGLVQSIEAAINEQIIPSLVQFNFKPKSRVSCAVHIEEVQHDRKRLLKEVYVELMRNLTTLARAGKVPNVLPSLKEMADILKIPTANFDEEYLSLPMDYSGGNGGERNNPPSRGNDLPENLNDGEKVIQIKSNKTKKKPLTKKTKKKASSVKREPVVVSGNCMVV